MLATQTKHGVVLDTNLPPNSWKHIVSGDFLIFSSNKSFLLRNRIIEVSVNHLLLQMESNSFRLSCIRFWNKEKWFIREQHFIAMCGYISCLHSCLMRGGNNSYERWKQQLWEVETTPWYLCISSFPCLNKLMDFHELLNECYDTWNHPNLILLKISWNQQSYTKCMDLWGGTNTSTT